MQSEFVQRFAVTPDITKYKFCISNNLEMQELLFYAFFSYLGKCSIMKTFWSPGWRIRHILAVTIMLFTEMSTEFILAEVPMWSKLVMSEVGAVVRRWVGKTASLLFAC